MSENADGTLEIGRKAPGEEADEMLAPSLLFC
jgi:hypothetical protein